MENRLIQLLFDRSRPASSLIVYIDFLTRERNEYMAKVTMSRRLPRPGAVAVLSREKLKQVCRVE